MNEGISVFSCGVSNQCPKGGDHQWDGEGVDFKSECSKCSELPEPDPNCKTCQGTGEWVSGGATTCSKCGVDSMSHALWNGP